MIMCQYLFAEFSLKDGVDDGLTAEQAEAVDRWRNKLRGIAVEEMLHLALVANLMSAIGAAPAFGRPNFPQRSGYFPGGCAARPPAVRRAGAASTSCTSNGPEGMERQDADGLRRRPRRRASRSTRTSSAPGPGVRDRRSPVPRHRRRAARRCRPGSASAAVFVGSPRAQATPELFRWPQLVAVTDLESALAAVEEIIEQGEGARGDWRRRALRPVPVHLAGVPTRCAERDPAFEPARPVLAAYTPPAVRHPRPAAGRHRSAGPPGRRAGGARLRAGAAVADAVLHPHRRDRRAARHPGRRGDRP